LGRALFEGLVAALLLTAGMLALEAFFPKFTSTTPVVSRLDRRTFADLGFSIAYPTSWKIVEDRYGVSFYSGERAGKASTRGFRGEPLKIAFKKVKTETDRIDGQRFPGQVVLETSRGKTRAGEGAYRRLLVAEHLRVEEWLIDRGSDVLRLEFWSGTADDEAGAVNARIVHTLELL
jgi:hypothetical protein